MSTEDELHKSKPDGPKRSSSHGVEVDPASQRPEDPIEFCADNEVAAGNEERANAEPEPAALHAAEVPGKPDPAEHRREVQRKE